MLATPTIHQLSIPRLLVALPLLALLLTAAAPAQPPVGSVEGRVAADGTGAAGVSVRVTNTSRGVTVCRTTTNSRGTFHCFDLPSGDYRVVFEKEGFARESVEPVRVRPGGRTELRAELVSTTVTEEEFVLDRPPLVDVRATRLSFLADGELLDDTPTERSVHALMATMPGVQSGNNYGVFQPGAVEVQNVLGAGERANSYRLDGSNTTDAAGQWNVLGYLPTDAVQEIQVVKAAKPAEIPFQGGLISVITRSGSSRLSGRASFRLRSDDLQDSAADRPAGAGVNEVDQITETGGSLGAPLLPGRLWGFLAAESQDGTTTIRGFPSAIDERIDSGLAKANGSMENHRVNLLWAGWDQDVSHFFLGYPPSDAGDVNAAAQRPVDGETAALQWSSTWSANLLIESSWSRTEQSLDLVDQPTAGIAVIDLVTGQRTGNTGQGSRDQDTRTEDRRISASWFASHGAHLHEVSVGAASTPAETSILFGDLGGHRLNTLFGRPFAVRVLSTPSLAVWETENTALFGQDRWSIGDRVALSLGLRWETTRVRTPEQRVSGGAFSSTALADRFSELRSTLLPATKLLSWDDWSPRLAASWSLDRDARWVLRAGASRYAHNIPHYDLFVANPAFPFTFLLRWDDRNGDRAFQVGEEGALLARFGGQLQPTDPGLARPHTDEYLLGLSHRGDGPAWWSRLHWDLHLVQRRDHDLINTVDVGTSAAAYTPRTVADPGRDGVLGTGDDAELVVFNQDPTTLGRSRLLLTNPPDNERTYRGAELVVSKPASRRWQAVASLLISEMEVIKPTTPEQTLDLFDDPNGLINAQGKDPAHAEFQFKLQGSVLLPWRLRAGWLVRATSGLPTTRELTVTDLDQGPVTVRAEPRGGSSTESATTLDLRLERSWSLRGSDLSLVLDLFNVTDDDAVLSYGTRTGVDYRQPIAVRPPRFARVGLRWSL